MLERIKFLQENIDKIENEIVELIDTQSRYEKELYSIQDNCEHIWSTPFLEQIPKYDRDMRDTSPDPFIEYVTCTNCGIKVRKDCI